MTDPHLLFVTALWAVNVVFCVGTFSFLTLSHSVTFSFSHLCHFSFADPLPLSLFQPRTRQSFMPSGSPVALSHCRPVSASMQSKRAAP